MTNTRIGDVEIAETRFPLLLREFSIRRGSGGLGRNKGGDGVHREYEARVPMEVSDATQATALHSQALTQLLGSAHWRTSSEPALRYAWRAAWRAGRHVLDAKEP